MALLVAGLAFSIIDGALAQNETASAAGHENANENAEGRALRLENRSRGDASDAPPGPSRILRVAD